MRTKACGNDSRDSKSGLHGEWGGRRGCGGVEALVSRKFDRPAHPNEEEEEDLRG
jgi:hypothetical protein